MADEIPPAPIIRIENLSKAFGSFVVLDDVTFDFPRGRTTAIIGPSGTGKSVLLKHIVGLMAPDAGHVWVYDDHGGRIDMATAREGVRYAARKRFGMLFQDGALFDSLTAGENVAFPLIYHTRKTEAERKQRAMEMLELVELPHVFDRPTAALSGGQRKRVGLARAIVMEPEVVLFDEPTTGLDPVSARRVDRLIRELADTMGVTCVVVSHDLPSIFGIADRVAFIYRGIVHVVATPAELRASEDPVVQQFIGGKSTGPMETPGF